MAKTKIDRVVKPVREVILKVINKKEEGKKGPGELKVVDGDGKVVKVFREAEYGPRYVFKATQYVGNYSTLEDPLTIE
jgi:hypothetical protein